MLNYICRFTTGGEIEISEEEYKKIIDADENASIFLKNGCMIKKRMVQVFPKNIADDLKDRQKQQVGILHDGTKCRKHYGQWVADNGEMPDDNGGYSPVRLDKEYYPEAALDYVASPKEYQKLLDSDKTYYEFFGLTNKVKRLENKWLQKNIKLNMSLAKSSKR